MKKMTMMAVALLLTACEKETETTLVIHEPEPMQEKTITFSIGQGVSTSVTDEGIAGTYEGVSGTRATLTELSLTDLWLFDYMGDELIQTVHAGSSDDGFGSLSLSMEYGDHTLYFVASRGTNPTVTAPTITWEKASDTFWQSVALTVAPSTSASQSVSMHRVATRLRISVTDEVPAGASQLKVSMAAWYNSLNVTTGAGVSSAAQERSVTIPSSYVGTNDKLTASFFGLSPSSEWTTSVNVTLTGASDVVLGTVALSDVAFKQNRTTVYSGGILGGVGTMDVTADDVWDADNTQTW